VKNQHTGQASPCRFRRHDPGVIGLSASVRNDRIDTVRDEIAKDAGAFPNLVSASRRGQQVIPLDAKIDTEFGAQPRIRFQRSLEHNRCRHNATAVRRAPPDAHRWEGVRASLTTGWFSRFTVPTACVSVW
jgi:hypothetical protein